MRIGLCDKEFEHITHPTRYHDHVIPIEIHWNRVSPEKEKIVVFTERCYDEAMDKKYDDKVRIAWPLEPIQIHRYAYKKLKDGLHKWFQYALTFDKQFCIWLNKNTAVKPVWWTPAGGWIQEEHHGIYNKSQMVQMIASKKDWTDGHRLRHTVAKTYGDKIDCYGWAYKPFDYTLQVFQDYRFAIVIENGDIPYYFTDKLTSAFYTHTIPIMWNSGWIGRYFDVNGMILWDNVKQLGEIIDSLTPELYESKMGAMKRNFEEAKKYFCVEDYMYNQFFCNLDK